MSEYQYESGRYTLECIETTPLELSQSRVSERVLRGQQVVVMCQSVYDILDADEKGSYTLGHRNGPWRWRLEPIENPSPGPFAPCWVLTYLDDQREG